MEKKLRMYRRHRQPKTEEVPKDKDVEQGGVREDDLSANDLAVRYTQATLQLQNMLQDRVEKSEEARRRLDEQLFKYLRIPGKKEV